MGYVQLAIAAIGLVSKIFSLLVERNKDKRRKKGEALATVTEGIKKRDAVAVTSGFDKFNRL